MLDECRVRHFHHPGKKLRSQVNGIAGQYDPPLIGLRGLSIVFFP
jgi:hypothetical protein